MPQSRLNRSGKSGPDPGKETFDEQEERTLPVCRGDLYRRKSIFVTTPARGVKFDGEENVAVYRSSAWAERGFCSKCGTQLFYRILDSDEYDMCVGTFDDQSEFVLALEIFIDRKPDAYALVGEHTRLTEAETLEKYKEFGE
jgi:hypothetical protein